MSGNCRMDRSERCFGSYAKVPDMFGSLCRHWNGSWNIDSCFRLSADGAPCTMCGIYFILRSKMPAPLHHKSDSSTRPSSIRRITWLNHAPAQVCQHCFLFGLSRNTRVYDLLKKGLIVRAPDQSGFVLSKPGNKSAPKAKPKARQRHHFAERKIKKKAPLRGRNPALASTKLLAEPANLDHKAGGGSNIGRLD
jgi:hypothetical protein